MLLNINMTYDIFDGDEIDELVSQLKDNDKIVKKASKERVKLDESNLEEFILKSSGELIEDSLEIIDNVKEYTSNAPDARESTSLAELIKAASGAIDTLNKVLLQNKKSKAQMDVKKLEMEARKGIANAENKTKLLLSREDLMDQLIKNADAIDIETDVD